jgi:hypothetical protein
MGSCVSGFQEIEGPFGARAGCALAAVETDRAIAVVNTRP